MELALVENIQREDLNAIEIALAYQQIIETHHLKHEEALAERVGKKRVRLSANYLRLLRLPAELQLGLTQRLIDMGHARQPPTGRGHRASDRGSIISSYRSISVCRP